MNIINDIANVILTNLAFSRKLNRLSPTRYRIGDLTTCIQSFMIHLIYLNGDTFIFPTLLFSNHNRMQ